MPVEAPVAVEEQVDLTPPVAQETEDEIVAAPDAEEVATPDPIDVLRAELAEVKERLAQPQRSEADITAEIEARLRSQRQSEEGRKAQRQTEQAELADSVKATLGAAGVYDADPQMVANLIERVTNKRETQISDQAAQSTLNDVADALGIATNKALGLQASQPLTQQSANLVGLMAQFIDGILSHPQARQKLVAPARQEWESALTKLAQASAAADRNKNRPKDDLRSPDGTPGTIDRSHDATIARVSSGRFDATDKQYWDQWRATRRA